VKLGSSLPLITRRSFVGGLACASGAVAIIPLQSHSAQAVGMTQLTARSGEATLRGSGSPPVGIWGYNGKAPGPILRVRQGDELHVQLRNKLTQPTTLHWHGIRIANAMDGVPGLTQEAVIPGGTFDYRFTCPDAGTFWYHPHKMSSEQVARGMHGVLIVEENDPLQVDQDLVLALDDWRLGRDGQIHGPSFGAIGERAHGGRYGNTFTLNGSTNHKIPVKAGERLRLRLCNVSNANIFGFRIADHAQKIIAIDGQPVEPHTPNEGIVVLGPGQRADVIVDMMGDAGISSKLSLLTFDEQHEIGQLSYHRTDKRRDKPLNTAVRLAANPLATKMDFGSAHDVTLTMEGGAMGGMRGASVDGKWLSMRQLVDQHGFVWSFNGTAGMPKKPLFSVPRGKTVKLKIVNQTGWPHAMHLHGHHYKEIARTGTDAPDPFWRDTVLSNPREELTMAFVADNPGKWMFHCHMLEHQEGGMATWFEVTT
jgi:FtsP/CotA-like multicopper oxidase with cupredoxin domain